jgi:hypothetical protein
MLGPKQGEMQKVLPTKKETCAESDEAAASIED